MPSDLTAPRHTGLSHAGFVGLLVQDEKTPRDNQRLKRLLNQERPASPAGLPGGHRLPQARRPERDGLADDTGLG